MIIEGFLAYSWSLEFHDSLVRICEHFDTFDGSVLGKRLMQKTFLGCRRKIPYSDTSVSYVCCVTQTTFGRYIPAGIVSN